MEIFERTLIDGYQTALGAFLAQPEDESRRAAYDAALFALGARCRRPDATGDESEATSFAAAEFTIECITAFELALQGYERTLIALNRRTIELIESNKILKDSNGRLQEFNSIAAHDLRAPLRRIIGFGAILKQRAGSHLPPPAALALDRIQTSAARMNSLLDSLLAYAKAASSGVLSRQRVSLRGSAEEAISDLELLVAQSQAAIELGRLDDVAGDPVQIRQLFQNLLENALKFHKPGTKPKIGISSVCLEDGRIELSVRDNGIGFDEKSLASILKPFERLNPAGDFEGSGLGLSVCAKIAARHDAAISARSALGQGAVFVITFPPVAGPQQEQRA